MFTDAEKGLCRKTNVLTPHVMKGQINGPDEVRVTLREEMVYLVLATSVCTAEGRVRETVTEGSKTAHCIRKPPPCRAQ